MNNLVNNLKNYWIVWLGALGLVFMIASTAIYLLPEKTLAQSNSTDSIICLTAHVENRGWLDRMCSSFAVKFAVVGTTEQSLRLEALMISTHRTGGVCARAHVQNIGWMRWECTNTDGETIEVGTTGSALRMEALEIFTGESVNNVGALCATAHVQNIGWQSLRCNEPGQAGVVQIGTIGESLRMEAVYVSVH